MVLGYWGEAVHLRSILGGLGDVNLAGIVVAEEKILILAVEKNGGVWLCATRKGQGRSLRSECGLMWLAMTTKLLEMQLFHPAAHISVPGRARFDILRTASKRSEPFERQSPRTLPERPLKPSGRPLSPGFPPPGG